MLLDKANKQTNKAVQESESLGDCWKEGRRIGEKAVSMAKEDSRLPSSEKGRLAEE